MKKFVLREVAVGLCGPTATVVERVLVLHWDSFNGECDSGVDPESGEMYQISPVKGGIAFNQETKALWIGTKVPAQNNEDCDLISSACEAYKKMRRKVEDALRKGGPRQVLCAAQCCGVTTLV